jgi:hypothetical protein
MSATTISEYWTGNAEDYERIEAWLQAEATARRIKVYRVSNHNRQESICHFHAVEFWKEGEFLEESVGYIVGVDVALGKWHEKYVKWSEKVDEEHTKIRMMLSDRLPSFSVFEGANLGFNDDDHFYHFEIVMHNEDIIDEFD